MKTLILLMLSTSFLFASGKKTFSQVNKNILETKITLQPGTIRIDSLLKKFSKETGVEFSFNSNKITPSRKLAVGATKRSIAQWLAVLNQSFGIQHQFVGNHIILIDNRNPKPNRQQKIGSNNSNRANSSNTASRKGESQQSAEVRVEPDSPTIARQPNPAVVSSGDSLRMSTPENLKKNSDPVLDVSTKQIQSALTAKVSTPGKTGKPGQTGQDNGPGNDEFIQIVLGYSRHGSGDMEGIVFGSEYWVDLSRKFSLGIMLRATINSDRDEIIFTNNIAGTTTDASVRFTTAGVQLGAIGALNFISTNKSRLGLGLGVFGRYQSASNGSDGYSILYPPVTNYPGALIEYHNSTPQHTFALGGLLQFQYRYLFNERLYAGAVAGFQTDTNGDAIPQLSLVFGRRFGNN